MTRPSASEIVARMTSDFERRCAAQGHYWAEFSPSEQYCQACGLRRPHAEESA